ncbi:hypothetical protein AA313_de0206343 [Arthrobotrys entomopaga]|nr:hypothetical protein AA313_de0206343 [Arthrobotrys entomopaga]
MSFLPRLLKPRLFPSLHNYSSRLPSHTIKQVPITSIQSRQFKMSTQNLIDPPSTSKAPHSDVAGASTRIDPDITHRHPAQVPEDAPARVSQHHKRTLPIFSLEGKTCVVTGGARG